MTDETAKELGTSFRDKLVKLETQVEHMIEDARFERESRNAAMTERRLELAALNTKIDQLEVKLDEKITHGLSNLFDKMDKITRLVYIGVGIGVAFNFILVMITAFKK